jgi:3-hydroxy-9,10-secoandrosta-1,3,5(10)-triene-9,17-dione monooxygenase
VRVEGGYRWTGGGVFASGVDHCNWLAALVFVEPDEPNRPPEVRWMLLPRTSFEIIDDWHAVGLRGTGSKSVVIKDAFVPAARTLARTALDDGNAPGREINDHPMYAGSWSPNFAAAMAAPAIGAARAFVDAFEDRLRKKQTPHIEDGLLINMSRYAHAAAQVDSAHALSLFHAQRFSRVSGRTLSRADRARGFRDRAFAAQACRQAVNALYEECGATGLTEKSELQRLWRDTNAAAAHQGLAWDAMSAGWTKQRLGLPTPPGSPFTV